MKLRSRWTGSGENPGREEVCRAAEQEGLRKNYEAVAKNCGDPGDYRDSGSGSETMTVPRGYALRDVKSKRRGGKMMKRLCMILAVFMLALVFVSSAMALTTEEKKEKYDAAILELETYLESNNPNGDRLDLILEAFEQLENYEHSKPFTYYVTVLQMIRDESYGSLRIYLNLLKGNERFSSYLENSLGDSPIRPAADLEAYAEGRKYESENNREKAEDAYEKCLGFFDADARYLRLHKEGSDLEYHRAEDMLKSGDFAGAYFRFLSMDNYKNSREYMDSIVATIGYIPASEQDNPGSVTGLRISDTSIYRISLSWSPVNHARGYHVYYRRQGAGEWQLWGFVSDSFVTVNDLEAATGYDFRVIAAVGEIETEPAELYAQKTATPTPTHSPTPTPTPTKTPTPTPTKKPTPTPTKKPTPTPTKKPTPTPKTILFEELYPGVTGAVLSMNTSRHMAKAGPGPDYADDAGYRPESVGRITAYFVENENYVYVRLHNQNKYLYFRRSSFSSVPDNIPTIDSLEYREATASKVLYPRLGPGESYPVPKNNKGKKIFVLKAGTPMKVFFEQNGYMFAEYTCEEGLVRMWVPKQVP